MSQSLIGKKWVNKHIDHLWFSRKLNVYMTHQTPPGIAGT